MTGDAPGRRVSDPSSLRPQSDYHGPRHDGAVPPPPVVHGGNAHAGGAGPGAGVVVRPRRGAAAVWRLRGRRREYRRFLDAHPANVEARSNLGVVLVNLGRYEDAIAEYTVALTAAPSNPIVRLNLGLALYKAARLDDAVDAFTRVLAATPDNLQARYLERRLPASSRPPGRGGCAARAGRKVPRRRSRPLVPARDGVPRHKGGRAGAVADRSDSPTRRLGTGVGVDGSRQARRRRHERRGGRPEACRRARSRASRRSRTVWSGAARHRQSGCGAARVRGRAVAQSPGFRRKPQPRRAAQDGTGSRTRVTVSDAGAWRPTGRSRQRAIRLPASRSPGRTSRTRPPCSRRL